MDYTLSNATITVGLTAAGGTLTSIKDASGVERLWQPDPAVWTGQAPICFPICGGLRDGRAVTASGDKIELARHGFAKAQEFELLAQTDSTLTLRLTSNDETRAQYPFDFVFDATYELGESSVTLTYSVTNTCERDLPFFVGGHPAFRAPVFAGEKYEDYQVVFEKDEPSDVPTPVVATGLIDVDQRLAAPQSGRVLPISHELFDPAETIYDHLESRSATLQNADGSHGVRLDFPELPYLVVWAKPAGDFVAVEPWGGLSTCSDEDDVFEHKRGLLVARPGETVSRGFTITVF